MFKPELSESSGEEVFKPAYEVFKAFMPDISDLSGDEVIKEDLHESSGDEVMKRPAVIKPEAGSELEDEVVMDLEVNVGRVSNNNI